MRWQAMLREMAAATSAAADETRRAEVAELARAERAEVRLADRVAGTTASVRVTLVDGDVLAGRPTGGGAGWFTLADGAREHLVHAPAVALLHGAALVSAGPGVGPQLGLGHALRAISRDRAPVLVRHAGGRLVGRVDQVGADHLVLAPVDEAGRPRPGAALLPFAALLALSSR